MFIPLLTKRKTVLQGNRNRRAAQTLKALNFPPVAIRKGLAAMNGVYMNKIDPAPVSTPTLYNTFLGKRGNTAAMKVIADALGVKVSDIFDDPDGSVSRES